jgi:hypothetical protein
MPRIRSMVVLLDDGTYRSIDVGRLRSVYIHGLPPKQAMLEGGDGDLASPPSEKPQWDFFNGKAEPVAAPMTRGGGGGDGEDGDPPTCFYVDGVWVCL